MLHDVNVSFNLNDKVQFKLTEVGLKLYSEYEARYNAINPGTSSGIALHLNVIRKEQSQTGYLERQVWDVMRVFGEHMSNGAPQIFVDNRIRLVQYKVELIIQQ